MSRSLKKGPFCQPALLKRIQAMNENGEKKIVKTWSRASMIFPDFVGHTISPQRTCIAPVPKPRKKMKEKRSAPFWMR